MQASGAQREASDAERLIEDLQQRLTSTQRQEAAAKAVLDAQRRAQRSGELLANADIRDITEPILNPPAGGEAAAPGGGGGGGLLGGLFGAPKPAKVEEAVEEAVEEVPEKAKSGFGALFGGPKAAKVEEAVEEVVEEVAEAVPEPAKAKGGLGGLFGGFGKAAAPKEVRCGRWVGACSRLWLVVAQDAVSGAGQWRRSEQRWGCSALGREVLGLQAPPRRVRLCQGAAYPRPCCGKGGRWRMLRMLVAPTPPQFMRVVQQWAPTVHALSSSPLQEAAQEAPEPTPEAEPKKATAPTPKKAASPPADEEEESSTQVRRRPLTRMSHAPVPSAGSRSASHGRCMARRLRRSAAHRFEPRCCVACPTSDQSQRHYVRSWRGARIALCQPSYQPASQPIIGYLVTRGSPAMRASEADGRVA